MFTSYFILLFLTQTLIRETVLGFATAEHSTSTHCMRPFPLKQRKKMICNNAIVFTKIHSVSKIMVLSMQCVLLHEQKYPQPSQIP